MKQRTMIQNARKVLSAVIMLAMLITMLPVMPVAAAQEMYPYTLFASSGAAGAITVTGNVCVNGDVATNGTISFKGSANNVNGKTSEHANEQIPDISVKLNERYFAGNNVKNLSGNYVSEEPNWNVSEPTVVQGTLDAKGNINLNASLKVSNDITIETDSLNANNAVLYSENGDISISGNNVSFTGLLYAPNGKISISAQHVNLNSVIVIADTIVLDTASANINYNRNTAVAVWRI